MDASRRLHSKIGGERKQSNQAVGPVKSNAAIGSLAASPVFGCHPLKQTN